MKAPTTSASRAFSTTRHLCLFFAIALAATSTAIAQTDLREAFADYQATWAKYQAAVQQAKSAEEVRALAEKCATARDAYSRLAGAGPAGQLPAASVGDLGAAALEAAPATMADATAPTEHTARVTGSNTFDITHLEAAVRSAGTPEARAECLARLIEGSSRAEAPVTTAKRIAQMAADRTLPTKWQTWAVQRAELHKLRVEVGQRRADLKAASQACNRASSKFRSTSWWALPVKLPRLANFLWDQFRLDQTYNRYSRAQQKAETVQAGFMSSPAIAWNATEIEVGGEHARVVPLIDNALAWKARWWALAQARESIDVQYFYAQRDPLALSLLGHLLVKAQHGVRIRLMLDGRGDSRPVNRFFREEGRYLLAALARHPNVAIRMYNPMMVSMSGLAAAPRRLVASNHDKIVLVDRKLAIIGGRNMAEYYFADPATDPGAFRDGDILIEGDQSARRIETAFTDEFEIQQDEAFSIGRTEDKGTGAPVLVAAYRAMDRHLRGQTGGPMPKTWAALEQQACAQAEARLTTHAHLRGVLSSEPLTLCEPVPTTVLDKHSFLGDRDDITDAVVRFIDGSRREIVLQNPMVILTDRVEAALQRASRRGVKILVHTNSPTSTDSMETQAMFMGAWKTWMQQMPTLRIWAFEKRKMHGKLFVFDGQIAIIGSYNLDYVSEQINSEITAAVYDAAFAQAVRSEIITDIGQSREYQVKRDAKGRIVSDNGPETMVTGGLKLKLELLSRLQFLKFLT